MSSRHITSAARPNVTPRNKVNSFEWDNNSAIYVTNLTRALTRHHFNSILYKSMGREGSKHSGGKYI